MLSRPPLTLTLQQEDGANVSDMMGDGMSFVVKMTSDEIAELRGMVTGTMSPIAYSKQHTGKISSAEVVDD